MSQRVVICSGDSIINLDVCDSFDSSFLGGINGVSINQIGDCINIVIENVNTMQHIIEMIINNRGSNSGLRMY